jgi:hypothetical protein
MGISATGSRGLSMTSIKSMFAVGAVVVGGAFYLYGPPVTPTLRAAAASACNEHSGGNFRSFRLHWDVGTKPAWTCWDASRPDRQAVSLGWWVDPFH